MLLIYNAVIILKGKILKYFSYRGFGFIKSDESQDELFFHSANYPLMEKPRIGNYLEFDIEESSKGKQAVNIKIILETE